MIILSQLNSVDPVFLSNSILVLFGVCGFVVALLTIWNHVRMKPPHETPTRREFDALQVKVSHIESTLPEMERRIISGVREASKDLSDRIDHLAEADHESRTLLWEKFNSENKAIGERVAKMEATRKS